MNQDLADKLLRLVAMLQDETAPVEWDEAAELLTDFPDGDYFLTRLRTQSISPLSFLLGISRSLPEMIDPCLSQDNRKMLLRTVLPYAFLLDARYTSLERACLIQEAGYNAVEFCEEIVTGYDRSGRFQDAASEALLAIAEHQNLLRGSEKSDIPANELLRAAQTGAARADSLLHPSEAPPVPEQKTGLLTRIKQRRFFARG